MALLEELREEEALRPKPLLGGKDLIDLGLAPGPRFREILEAIETAQLEGQLADRESALAFVRERCWRPARVARPARSRRVRLLVAGRCSAGATSSAPTSSAPTSKRG